MGDWKDKLKELRNALAGEKKNTPGLLRLPEHSAGKSRALEPKAPMQSPTLPKRYVCLGLDFGTSSTKAVARLLPTGPAYAISFEGIGSAGQPYLAPTRLAVMSDGSFLLTAPKGADWVEDLKVKMMEAPWQATPVFHGAAVSARPVDLAAGYVALVLQKALVWCDASIRPVLGQAEIVWSVNLGIPARDFDATSIKDAFLTVVLAGWHLASEKSKIDLTAAAKAVDLAREGNFSPRGIDRSMVSVIPEVAAGVTTYARSPQRRMGAHLFVDVGATTLDASMFLLNESQDGLRYAFLSADVDSQLGALRLHRYRADQLGLLALARFTASDPLNPIPLTAQDCVPPAAEIDTVDEKFCFNCVKKLGKVVWTAKMKDFAISVPHNGPAEPIQVLLSGGGIRLPLYQYAIWETGRRVAPGGGMGLLVRPFQEAPIPRPSDLRAPDLSDDDWQRLGIAYGLSFSSEDIGEFIPPSAIGLMPPRPRRDEDDRFVSKDQM